VHVVSVEADWREEIQEITRKRDKKRAAHGY
jgi:hypothetical protein